ncbi:MAG: protein kinase [Blastocatellia bacterium]|nr:protein kinase [Blastocatellia bacterium]
MPELKLENSLVDDRYEVVERLSRGSFAEIFVARDREAGGMEVVLKALNTSLQGTPDADLERTLIENFQNEAVALDAVRHPHVILRWGHGAAADLRGTPFYYLSLEYMPGGDLLKLCRARPGAALPLDDALFYFKQACEALAYAHDKGIIHRDLKPNNFLLSADHRTLKIADFGVAKIATGEDNEITRVGADIYAPPEHHPSVASAASMTGVAGKSGETGEASGESPCARNRLTASADIYSLAKSFYTTVCGRPPSQFTCDPITQLPADSMSEPVRRRLLEVLRRATDGDPAARYASVIEFWSDLAQVASVSEEAPVQALEDADDTTIIRPRLNVAPGALPNRPAQPDFDPQLATSRLPVNFATATLVETPRSVQSPTGQPAFEDKDLHQAQSAPKSKPGDRSPKFFIELQENRPTPAAQTQVKAEPPAAQVDLKLKSPAKAESPTVAAPPAKADSPAKTEQPGAKRLKQATDRFNQKVRRNIFTGLMVFTLLGAMVKVDRYVRNQPAPLGFGPPTEIQIVADGLKVRSAPSSKWEEEKVLGSVAKGTVHEVLDQSNSNWIKIRVHDWATKKPSVDTDTGWIYGDLDGNPPNVRVVSRKFWR